MQKIMFSRTVRHAESKSLKVENGPLADAGGVVVNTYVPKV
jgi:hypothetical protein